MYVDEEFDIVIPSGNLDESFDGMQSYLDELYTRVHAEARAKGEVPFLICEGCGNYASEPGKRNCYVGWVQTCPKCDDVCLDWGEELRVHEELVEERVKAYAAYFGFENLEDAKVALYRHKK